MSEHQDSGLSPKLPRYTWIGLLVMASAQVGLQLKLAWVATWLTPLMWSGYILFLDGLLFHLQGRSWLTSRKLEFPLLLILSIAIWLLFEAYNFHIQNWLYRGVPQSAWLRNLAYAWSFATIVPGVFLTAEFLLKILPSVKNTRWKNPLSSLPAWLWLVAGAAMVIIPLSLPVMTARYTFGAVWLGFIFLLDPVNQKLGFPSLRKSWERGDYPLTVALLLGGLICGLLWEAWNYQAFRHNGGHWIYTVPKPLRIFDLHYGQMPLLGMLGFPPFALELYLMYHCIRGFLDIEKFLGKLDW